MKNQLALCIILLFAHASFAHARELAEIIIPEVTTKTMSGVDFVYKFPSPVHAVTINLNLDDSRHRIGQITIKRGDGIAVSVPQQLTNCIPLPRIDLAGFLFVQPIKENPNWSKSWWNSITIPYGDAGKTDESDKNDPVLVNHIFPYLEIEMRDDSITRVIIHRSPKERRVTRIFDSCPEDAIKWSLEAKERH